MYSCVACHVVGTKESYTKGGFQGPLAADVSLYDERER